MRRVPAEWPLVVLFLAPVLAAVAYATWAERAYRADLRREIAAARTWVSRSLEGDQGHYFHVDLNRSRVLRVYRLTGAYTMSLPDSTGRTYEWQFQDPYPQGAGAGELADSETRSELEGGTPAAVLDPPTSRSDRHRFAALYRNPSLDALRVATLPAGTVLYLLDRLPADTHFPESRSAARDALRQMAYLQVHGIPTVEGLHRTPLGRVFRLNIGDRFELRFWPPDQPFGLCRRTMGELVTVAYGDRPSAAALWSAEIDAPVRGTFSLEARRGRSWWNVPRYARWFRPALAVTAVYLAVLSALALTMRRRRQLDEARARFLTEIAHDLRTPLTSVRLHAELLASPKRRADREEKYLRVLEREAARASELLANLLDLSRLDRGQRVYEPETRRMDDLIQPCVAEFRQLYPDRSDDLTCEGDTDASVHVDSSAFQRCLTNLLDNAGKYTKPGTSIRVAWSGVVVRVKDDGPGVPASERGRLFRRYVRGSRIDGIAGTGLGLSLVKELMEGMGGSVEYRNDEPGACFELRLPGGERA